MVISFWPRAMRWMKVIRKAGLPSRDDVHEAIEQREPFSWLGVDGQPVPLESDEQVLALIQAHGGNARRAAYAMTSGLGAAAEAGARKRL